MRQKPQKNNISFSNLPQEVLPLNSLLLVPHETMAHLCVFTPRWVVAPEIPLHVTGENPNVEESKASHTGLHCTFFPTSQFMSQGKK